MLEATTFDSLWTQDLRDAGHRVFATIEGDLDRIITDVYMFLLDIPQRDVTADQIARGHIKFQNILVGNFSQEYFETQQKTARLLIDQGVSFVTYLLCYAIYHREAALCICRENVADGKVDDTAFQALHLALQCDAATTMHSYFTQLEQSNRDSRGKLLKNNTTKIDDAVKVINSLSVQTNMLAVNASVEAARAGDAGLGFAVIAKEIQSMATKARLATDDISKISSEFENAINE